LRVIILGFKIMKMFILIHLICHYNTFYLFHLTVTHWAFAFDGVPGREVNAITTDRAFGGISHFV
jgi:hypothetical protein